MSGHNHSVLVLFLIAHNSYDLEQLGGQVVKTAAQQSRRRRFESCPSCPCVISRQLGIALGRIYSNMHHITCDWTFMSLLKDKSNLIKNYKIESKKIYMSSPTQIAHTTYCAFGDFCRQFKRGKYRQFLVEFSVSFS